VINERAELTVMLMKPVSAPLICIKAFRYSARETVMPTPSSASAHSLQIFQRELVMSDADRSADNIRAMLTEANGRLRRASTEYFELLEKGLTSSPLRVADQVKQFCNYLQRNVMATFDLGDKLVQAKDVQDALKIQSEFFQDQMRALTDQAKSIGESAMKAATGAFTPKS
jgi:phasin